MMPDEFPGHHEDVASRAVREYVGIEPEKVDLVLLKEMRLALDALWTRACAAQQKVDAA